MTEHTDDDSQWFEKGSDNFPRHLPEDCIKYSLFLIDSELQAVEVRSKLRQVQKEAKIFVKSLCKDFIWQRDAFDLRLVHEGDPDQGKVSSNNSQSASQAVPFLQGKTSFGDSIDDEWLIVYILCQLSVKYPDLWIRVVDADGQFLLIEAASVLPQWLGPENAEYRVWINQGRLLIVPRNASNAARAAPADARPTSLTLQNALRYIENGKSNLLHLPEIEEEAFYRTRRYATHLQDSIHHARVTVPRKLAWLLHQEPSYIAPAIEAFYLRDPISLRTLQKSQMSNLVFPLSDFVTMSAKFPKAGYAQIMGQQVEGLDNIWATVNSEYSPNELRRSLETGKKVTAGFEMLLADPQNKDRRVVREIQILLDDLNSGEEQLPTDRDMQSWSQQADAEQWLEVNFAEFDHSLSEKVAKGRRNLAGFADKATEAHLEKIVGRFESLMEDEDLACEENQMSDADEESSAESDPENEQGSEHGEVKLDEVRFDAMMREMTGFTQGGRQCQPSH